MLRRFTPLQQAGDTIVEVMIVLAVLGLAMGIAYATANRSLLNTRQAQENSEATELAQSQLEALRTMTQDTGSDDIFSGNIPTTLTPATAVCVTQAAPYHLTQNALGSTPCDIGSEPYAIGLTYNAPATPNTFTVTVTWPDINGQGTDSVTLSDRIYPP